MASVSSQNPNFYSVEAVAIYGATFDFTVSEDTEPLQTLPSAIRSVCSRALVTVAAVAFSGVLTFSERICPSAMSTPTTVAADSGPRDGPDIVQMTEYMRVRASLASRIFARTPHPGANDSDPDYGF